MLSKINSQYITVVVEQLKKKTTRVRYLEYSWIIDESRRWSSCVVVNNNKIVSSIYFIHIILFIINLYYFYFLLSYFKLVTSIRSAAPTGALIFQTASAPGLLLKNAAILIFCIHQSTCRLPLGNIGVLPCGAWVSLPTHAAMSVYIE